MVGLLSFKETAWVCDSPDTSRKQEMVLLWELGKAAGSWGLYEEPHC